MNKLTFLVPALLIITGCKSTDISRAVKDGINGAVGGMSNSTNQMITSSTQDSYSTSKEEIAAYHSKKTSRDYGKLQIVKTAKNPKGRTQIKLSKCVHPRIGNVNCKAYLYEVTPEGWLIEDYATWLDLNDNKVVPAGNYYFKVVTEGVASKSYATGELSITPFVTNYLDVTFE